MTVQEYERLKSSKRPDDIASVRLYVQGFFNGITWASTKSKTEFGLELVCNTDAIGTPEQAFAVIDQEIRRKKLAEDVKAILPLSLIFTEALFRQYPCMAPSPTHGTLMPGPKFVQLCNSTEPGLMGLCAGFINAIVEIWNTVPLYGRRACFPATFTVQNGMTVVQRWMQKNPNDVKYDAREITVVALAEAYPCIARRGN
ncbi:MAG: Rap1a/Tai family immunity protein [Burkholderiales bacterium]